MTRFFLSVLLLIPLAACAPAVRPSESPSEAHLIPFVISRGHLEYWQAHIDTPEMDLITSTLKPDGVTPDGAVITVHESARPERSINVECDQIYRLPSSAGDRYYVFSGMMKDSVPDKFDLPYLHTETAVGKDEPDHGRMGQSLVRVLSDPKRGEIFQLNWPSELIREADHTTSAGERRFILQRDAVGQWKVLLEFPGGSRSRGVSNAVTLRIKWNHTPGAAVPILCEVRLETVESTPARTTVLYGELDAGGKLKWAPHRFLLQKREGDAFASETLMTEPAGAP